MIELFTWPTPNGTKPSIMLEEVGVPYSIHLVNLGSGEQHAPRFLAVSPNGKIPAIVDHDGQRLSPADQPKLWKRRLMETRDP